MMTYADGFHSYSVIGISLVVGSASTAAIYKVKWDYKAQQIHLRLSYTNDLLFQRCFKWTCSYFMLSSSVSVNLFLQVLLKLVLGSAKLGEAAVYLTVLGGANLVFISAVPLILLLMGAEDFVSPRDLPWPSICGMSALLLGKRMDTNTQTQTSLIYTDWMCAIRMRVQASDKISQ